MPVSREMVSTFLRECGRTILRPKRLLTFFRKPKARERFWSKWRRLNLRARFGTEWTEDLSGTNLERREYRSYEQYLAHQRDKLGRIDKFLDEYVPRFYNALVARLGESGVDWRGKTVLCLAARLGTEVRAFIDHGAFAVGIDLNPGPDNRYVVVGDFHDLQYADASVDFVFTNSLDHSLDPARMLSEVRRVLKPDGRLLVEADAGRASGRGQDFYAALWWDKPDDLVALIESHGFQLVHRETIADPWPGEHLRFAATNPRVSP